ncbi:MAG: hypothetical protein NC412_10990 [Roseburia sp.]|nr:hypothetical protein [Roseburia sp.]MCM1279121.1 hypothetical protein [Robinsoniella sp.]
MSFFVIWSLLNQWIGVVACAIAFCSIAPDFAEICKSYSNQIRHKGAACYMIAVAMARPMRFVEKIDNKEVSLAIQN